ncbi:MAG: TRAP transporter small permease [Thermodesulfobacteriota bacterium]
MFYRLLSRLVEWLVIVAAAIIVGAVTIEVILRYVFGGSLVFTEELTRYVMVWIVFLGSALAIRDNTHIGIDVVVKRLGPKPRAGARLTAHLLTLLFLAALTVEGFRILPRQLEQTCITMDVPILYFYLAIPVGGVLMMLFLAPKFKEAWRDQSAAGRPEMERNLRC